jgi:siderophore synthetase component
MTPDTLGCQALLNCLIREVSGPEEQVREEDGQLFIMLARSDVPLRAELRRPSAGIGPRFTGHVQARCAASSPGPGLGSRWRTIGAAELARLIAAELTMASGVANEEFAAQVTDSHAASVAILGARRPPVLPGGDRVAGFLASEQALVAGHRFHPAPKARPGAPRDWLRYAPEAGARFGLRFLAVRDEAAAGEGDTTALGRLGGPVPPDGYQLLPAHPWQLRLLEREAWFGRALAAGWLADLGEGTRDVVATSSVRTVYDPAADVFCKFSLNVRLTNCVRKSAWYELAGSVLLTGVLEPVCSAGLLLLREPGYRTAALASRAAYEGLAVIVREGVLGRLPAGLTPLLAASLAEPGCPLFDGRDRDWLLGWWQAYVRVVAPPVLDAFFSRGVVLEPHLQNVLAAVDRDGWPARAVFRDLEGVKLVTPRHDALLAGLPARVAAGLRYDARRGWDRVAYCLFVNHLAEIAAAIADSSAAIERDLWRLARDELSMVATAHGWPPELRAVLAGVPLPAKANLRVRWVRAADRDAQYVPVPNPLRPPRASQRAPRCLD